MPTSLYFRISYHSNFLMKLWNCPFFRLLKWICIKTVNEIDYQCVLQQGNNYNQFQINYYNKQRLILCCITACFHTTPCTTQCEKYFLMICLYENLIQDANCLWPRFLGRYFGRFHHQLRKRFHKYFAVFVHPLFLQYEGHMDLAIDLLRFHGWKLTPCILYQFLNPGSTNRFKFMCRTKGGSWIPALNCVQDIET